MSSLVFFKLLTIFIVVAIDWIGGKLKWLGAGDPARTLANAAQYIFVPALLFSTTARIDFKTVPWDTLVAVFVPMLAMMVVVHVFQRYANRSGALPVAAPGRARSRRCSATRRWGLAIHLANVSLHARVLPAQVLA